MVIVLTLRCCFIVFPFDHQIGSFSALNSSNFTDDPRGISIAEPRPAPSVEQVNDLALSLSQVTANSAFFLCAFLTKITFR
jgi:hypothetical protein